MSYRGTSCSRVKSEGEAALLCLPVQTEVVRNEVLKALGLIQTPYGGEANGGTFNVVYFHKMSSQKCREKNSSRSQRKIPEFRSFAFVLSVSGMASQLEVSVLNDGVTTKLL